MISHLKRDRSTLTPNTLLIHSQVIHREWACSRPGTAALSWRATLWTAVIGNRCSQKRTGRAWRRGHEATCDWETRGAPWAFPLWVLLLGTVRTLFIMWGSTRLWQKQTESVLRWGGTYNNLFYQHCTSCLVNCFLFLLAKVLKICQTGRASTVDSPLTQVYCTPVTLQIFN